MVTRYFIIAAGAAILAASMAFAESTVPFLSGGVGEDERAQIEAAESEYNLKLVYTGERGMYLSDVHVIIRDAKDHEQLLVDEYTTGPFMLIKLPAGRYTVESFAGDFNKKLTVKLGEKLRTLGVNFPVKDEPVNIPMYRNDALEVLSPDMQPKAFQQTPAPAVSVAPAISAEPKLGLEAPNEEPMVEIIDPVGE